MALSWTRSASASEGGGAAAATGTGGAGGAGGGTGAPPDDAAAADLGGEGAAADGASTAAAWEVEVFIDLSWSALKPVIPPSSSIFTTDPTAVLAQATYCMTEMKE